MEYDVDEEYPFKYDETTGFAFLPHGLTEDGNLYVLPNGKYLPCGCYICEDDSTLIYEPDEISFFGKLLRESIDPNDPNAIVAEDEPDDD